jgi:hypothetical protein
MSICFLKSSDNHSSISSYNPNKPYRWTNYLTQAIRLPPNSQVAYVSSQFAINANIDIENQPSYIQTADETMPMTMITQFAYEFPGTQYGTILQNINSYVYSANEFGMDSDYASVKLVNQTHFGEIQKVYERGFQLLYDATNQKTELRTDINLAIDQYNLYFNCLRGNPGYSSVGWASGPGATIPSGLNFTDKVDSKFQQDCSIAGSGSPDGISTFATGNVFGFSVGEYTNNSNALARIYAGTANFYNTGFAVRGLNSSLYDYLLPASATDIPDFDDGSYAGLITKTGIKKSIGNFTPSSDPQQSNSGGHVSPGGFSTPSGGYAIFGQSNTLQADADQHYDATSTPRVGYTGYAPQFVGVHSIPFVRKYGREIAEELGYEGSILNDFNFQFQNYVIGCDLNKGSEVDATNGYARFLLGIDIREEEEAPGDIRTKCFPQVLDPSLLSGSYNDIFDSDYGLCGNPLDLFELSQGTNTACVPPYVFDATANYSINTYNVTAGRTAAALWFRFRWVNKTQMVIEFTLQVDGHAGTYDPNTDSVFEPAANYANPPDAATADPRDKWCILGRMDFGSQNFHIPSYMGDIGLVHYPIASQVLGTDMFRSMTKGWFDVRETNRFYQSNNNGGNNQYEPYSSKNPFFNEDALGTLCYDTSAPQDDEFTSANLINAGYANTTTDFDGAQGALETTSYYMSIPELSIASDVFYDMFGNPAFLRGQPETEIGYILGFREIGNTESEIESVQDATTTTLYKFTGAYRIRQSNNAFTNHIQLTNLPILSQNGVVSSTNKTIYVCDTLCLDKEDSTGYRYYCDKATFPLWIDLNNLETIELNRIDVLITNDKNTPQTSLTNNTDLVVIFRSKTEGTLPNTIAVNSMNMTRTY